MAGCTINPYFFIHESDSLPEITPLPSPRLDPLGIGKAVKLRKVEGWTYERQTILQ